MVKSLLDNLKKTIILHANMKDNSLAHLARGVARIRSKYDRQALSLDIFLRLFHIKGILGLCNPVTFDTCIQNNITFGSKLMIVSALIRVY